MPIIRDSLYTVTFTTITGYNFTELKFTADDKMELEGQPNRKIYFDKANQITYKAEFNKQ